MTLPLGLGRNAISNHEGAHWSQGFLPLDLSRFPSFLSLWTWASLVAQTVKSLPAGRETGVQSLSRENPLEQEMATHSSIPAWKIPWTEEPGGLQSMGSQRVGYGWATSLSLDLRRRTEMTPDIQIKATLQVTGNSVRWLSTLWLPKPSPLFPLKLSRTLWGSWVQKLFK